MGVIAMESNPIPLHLRQSEAQFQEAVEEYARLHGWLVFHDQDSRGNEPGFPDDLFARGGVVVIAEFKTEGGKVSTERRIANKGRKSERVLPSQHDWIMASGAYVWRPSDWPQIEEVLS